MLRLVRSLLLGGALLASTRVAAADVDPGPGGQPPRRVRLVVRPDGVEVIERPFGKARSAGLSGDAQLAPRTVVLDELTLREARVFRTDPLAPLSDRLLALRSPGLQLSGAMVADVQAEATATRLPPLPDGSYAYEPFGPQDMAFNQVNAYSLAHDFVNDWFCRHGWDHGLAFIGLRIYSTPSSLIIGQYEGGYAALHPALVNGVVRHTAKDADLVRHEVAHAVLIPSLPMNPAGDPDHYHAFHEGMADYYAAIAGPDPRLGEWLVPGGLRDLTTTDAGSYHMSRFPLLKANPYEAGRILSGALIEIRRTLGERLDELVVDATYQAAPASLDGFADAIRRADLERHGGLHLGAIEAAFARHGLAPGSRANVTYDGPWFVSAGMAGTYAADVFGGYGPFTITWRASTDGGATWQTVGRGDLARLAFAQTCLLRCDATDQVGGVSSSLALPITVFQGEVPPPVTSVGIVGPTTLPPGTPARYTLSANSAVRSPAAWSFVPDVGPSRGFLADAVEIAGSYGSFTLRVAVSGVTGGQANASLRVTVPREPAFVETLPTSALGPDPVPEWPTAPTRIVRALCSRAERVMAADFGAAPGAGGWRAQLFDVRGRIIASAEGATAHGAQPLWSLDAVPPGVYFVRVTTRVRTATARTVVVP